MPAPNVLKLAVLTALAEAMLAAETDGYDPISEDGPTQAEPETEATAPLTLTIERQGEQTIRATTDRAVVVFEGEDGVPHARVLGDQSDIGVCVGVILAGVIEAFGPDVLDEFIEKSVGLAEHLVIQNMISDARR